MVLVGLLGEGAIWYFLTNYFNRPRPIFAVPVWHQMTYPTYPSGHSFGAVVLFGLLVYLIAAKTSSRFWKWVVVALGLLITLYIGFSRMFVGDHYTTDILAGYALGIAWAGFAYTMVELTALRNRQHKQVRQEQVRT
jgi:undecaprenyl-diphosphatase